MKNLLEELGLDPTEHEVDDIFYELDKDGDGVVLLHEFACLLEQEILGVTEE